MNIHGFMCGPTIYEFDGWTFEFSPGSGPWPLRKDGELRKLAGRRFWDVFDRWYKMTEAERRRYKVGGGCVRF